MKQNQVYFILFYLQTPADADGTAKAEEPGTELVKPDGEGLVSQEIPQNTEQTGQDFRSCY